MLTAAGRERVAALLEALVAGGVAPGMVLALASSTTSIPEVIAAGRLSWTEDAAAAGADTIYDLASLSKLLGTAAVAMSLVADGSLDLHRPVSDILGGYTGGDREQVRVTDLLCHRAGYQATELLFRTLSGDKAIRDAVRQMPLVHPPRTRTLYSDLGMIVLGDVVEAVGGAPLEDLVRDRVTGPLRLTDTRYRPPAELLPRVAPTEDDSWRGRVMHGEVHDENAYAMGGVAAHAGLFATAGDVARFGRSLLPGTPRTDRLTADSVIEMFLIAPAGADVTWAHGVRLLDREPIFGTRLSAGTVGLTGFTGTFLAVDRRRDLALALLANRVHPTRRNAGVIPARGLVLDAVLAALG